MTLNRYDGMLIPGKVHPSHGCLYICYDGEEISMNEYEVLVEGYGTNLAWIRARDG